MSEVLHTSSSEAPKQPRQAERLVTQKAVVLGQSRIAERNRQIIPIGKGGLEAASRLAMNTGMAFGLVPFEETVEAINVDGKQVAHRSEPPIMEQSSKTEVGIVYINGKILTPETVRAINRTPVNLDTEVDKYVITTWGGIRPFREGVDSIIQVSRKKK